MTDPYKLSIQTVDTREEAEKEIVVAKANGVDPRTLAKAHVNIAYWMHRLLDDEEKP